MKNENGPFIELTFKRCHFKVIVSVDIGLLVSRSAWPNSIFEKFVDREMAGQALSNSRRREAGSF